MNVLFLTIGRLEHIEARSLYPDLLRQFRDHGHEVYVVSAREKRCGLPTECVLESGVHILRLTIGDITKCSLVKKGISTLQIGGQYRRAIEQYFPEICFDLVLYSTPPITLTGAIGSIKARTHARTYLLLKDIFPQNAVDLGMMQKTGVKSVLYRYFRRKECRLYALSDRIGCMSPANKTYLLAHNPQIPAEKVEVCPNSVEVVDRRLSREERSVLRRKYGIPEDRIVFLYGGNLGKPQDIPFIIKCLERQKNNREVFFLLVGDGTEFGRLERFFREKKPENMKLLQRLPKEDYERMTAACDIGLIFLDHRFTIPNFPSRLLSYLQAGLPVLACTDTTTDLGSSITQGGFGWWCESSDVENFANCVKDCCHAELAPMGEKGFSYLKKHFSVEAVYEQIMGNDINEKI